MTSNELLQADDASISLYCGDLPSVIESELVLSYEMLQSSLPFFRVFRSLEGANCYLARRDGHPSTVLLFTCRNGRVDVLNEMIEVEQSDIERFAKYVFSRFKTADVITFKALKTTTCGFGFPVQKHDSKDTYVIALPATPEAYTSSIGKSTRANIRQQTNGLARHFPSFESRFFTNEDIGEEHIRTIIGFSEQKISAKGVRFAHDIDRITRLARMCGFVNVFLINGCVCAGSINYRVGASYFGEVTGYDAKYEKYGLGKFCVHQTICESIARGGTKFYLGGGVFDFKQRMLGAILSTQELHIYRSRLKMLAHIEVVAKAFVAGQLRRLKKQIHLHGQEKWAKFIFSVAHFFKNRVK